MILLLLLQLQITQKPLPIRKKELRDSTISHIVIHNDGANSSVNSVFETLKRKSLQYHYFIDKSGIIYNFVPVHLKANHAGISRWNNLINWNDFSIGICLQGSDKTEYSDNQYISLQRLIATLYHRYPDLPIRKILGHSEIAYPRGRKKDPGKYFVWDRIR
jgi:AmpD protein